MVAAVAVVREVPDKRLLTILMIATIQTQRVLQTMAVE